MRLLHRLKGAGIFFIYFLFLGTFPAGNYFDTCNARMCARDVQGTTGKKKGAWARRILLPGCRVEIIKILLLFLSLVCC